MNNPARIAIAILGAALIALLVWWLGGRTPAQPKRALEPLAAEVSEPPGPAEPTPAIPSRTLELYAGEIRVESGETLVIDAASLEPGRPVVLRLDLGEASPTDEPRPARLLGPPGTVHEREAPLGAERTNARFEIDSEWLAPGRYIVEVKTAERSHFPLRRYAVEVR